VSINKSIAFLINRILLGRRVMGVDFGKGYLIQGGFCAFGSLDFINYTCLIY